VGVSVRLGLSIHVHGILRKSTEDDSGASQVKHGLGHSLLSVLSNPECHEVFFDNFITSYDLLAHLKSLKIKATGTAREN